MSRPATPSAVHFDSRPRSPRTEPWAWTLLSLLLLQNIVGIYLNLFVSLPQSTDLGALLAAYSVLAFHVAVGFLILGTAGILLFLTARTKRLALWLPALGALAFALLAFSSGVEFTVGGQDDALSFLMELFFLGVVGCDVVVLYVATRLRTAEPAVHPARPARE